METTHQSTLHKIVDFGGELCSLLESEFNKKAHLTWAYGYSWMGVEIIRYFESARASVQSALSAQWLNW